MATWTAPTTRSTGDLISASIWNTDLTENLKYLKDAPVFDTAAIIGAATTAGIRLDLESGVLAVREGDDSAYGPMRSGILYVVGSAPAATPTWQSADSAIVSGTTNNVLQLHSGTNSGSQAVAFSVGSTRSKAGYGYDNSNDALYFTTNSTERARIDSSGSVLVAGASTSTTYTSAGQIGIKRSNSLPFMSWHGDDGTRLGYIQMASTTNSSIMVEANQALALGTNGSNRLNITSGGNVAIAATAKLYLDGTAATGNTYLAETAADDVSLLVGNTVKMQARTTNISVSTSATTILDDAGGVGAFCIINGEASGNRFCDLVLASTGVNPTVVASFTALGSPVARTYSRSGSALQLAMASGTYTVNSMKLGS